MNSVFNLTGVLMQICVVSCFACSIETKKEHVEIRTVFIHVHSKHTQIIKPCGNNYTFLSEILYKLLILALFYKLLKRFLFKASLIYREYTEYLNKLHVAKKA